jgi:hypothetical protein
MATAEFNNRSQQWTVDKHILARWSSFKRFDFIAAGSMTFIGGNDSERVRTEYGDDVLRAARRRLPGRRFRTAHRRRRRRYRPLPRRYRPSL